MARWTIERRVTLLASALALAVGGALAVAAYRQVRTLTAGSAEVRATRRARDFADLFNRSVAARTTAMDSVAKDSGLQRFVRAHGAGPVPAALRRLRGNGANRTMVVLDAAGHQLYASDSLLRRPPGPEDARPVAGVTPMYRTDSVIAYRMSRPIRANGVVTGWMVDRSRVVLSAQARQAEQQLLGGDSHILLGNASADIWTDVTGHVPGPTQAPTLGVPFTYAPPGSEPMLAVALPIAATPWAVLVTLPQSQIDAPIRAFLRQVAIIAALLVVVGSFIAFRVSRSITTPLRHVSAAAQDLASGNLATRVPVARDDEVGDLSRAFNLMAERVADSTHNLEHQVADRTKALALQLAEVEAVNREIETFSYSVSHDLRAPLRAIDGFSRILETEHAATLDAEGRRILGVIRNNAQRMGQLVDDLLQFSRFGRQALTLRAVDMSGIARSAASDLLNGRAAQVSLNIAAMPKATADHRLVQHVWTNLIGNAIKYSGRQDRPAIDVAALPETDQGQNVYFVKDNGVGFDPAYTDKLFGVFQRLHRDDEFEGTGVGLAIVQRIVHRHGGRVWGEGRLGAGATFYFTLPAEA
jgi:signal transduction histidine kinase